MTKSNWVFIHSELECDTCESNDDYGILNFYEGTYYGKYAHKYECTNCDYKEILTEKQLREKEGIE